MNDSQVEAVNLPISILDAEFCYAMTRYANNIVIKNATFMTSIAIPENCHINSLAVFLSTVKQIEFEQNNYIKQLVVRMSDLRKIPPTIHKLENLLEATFQISYLESVDLSLFCPSASILKLDLFRNNITTVTGVSRDVVCQSALKIINLNGNKIKELSLDVFSSFKRLVMLDLSQNKLESLGGSLANPELKQLSLTNNQLTVLDMCTWSKPIEKLGLHVAHNNLTEIPRCIEALGDVTFVDLRFNRIREVDVQALHKLPKLECIHFAYNNITAIPMDESLYPPTLKILKVHNNPLANVSTPIVSFNRLNIILDRRSISYG
ncbi:toll-like receptor 7 [Anopheles maculipalpis]|uniref:toll-like receptor 7 n=1 Tax=Anopheles maculipalpis TaxID=1496333 RepID=UPI0021599B3D|nr:toll-like receptor 7 [Anopheles maculipalpis]